MRASGQPAAKAKPYYRVGEGEWTACSEGEASAIEVIELDDVVLITIGDTVITLPKESVSDPIESIANVLAKAGSPSPLKAH